MSRGTVLLIILILLLLGALPTWPYSTGVLLLLTGRIQRADTLRCH
jgi:Protein of unknown function (DUF3309)